MTDQDLYDIIESARNYLFRSPTMDDKARNGEFKRAFIKFSDSGWIPYLNFSIPQIVNLSKHEPQWIDDYVYAYFVAKNFRECKLVIKRLKKFRFDNPRYFTCAMTLYRKKEYMGCCMMILALIEQTISHVAGRNGAVLPRSKKTIENAFLHRRTPFGGYPEASTKYLMMTPFEKIMGEYFKSVSKDDPEPPTINRNMLMHGVARREYTHRDCIKLFVFLEFIGHLVWEEDKHAQPTT